MKKDIEIPREDGVQLVAVKDFHEELGEQVWNIFLFNESGHSLETVMVVLRGFSEAQKTSVMRKTLDRLEPGSLARLEFLRADLLEFRNEYLVTYFHQNAMYERNFVVEPGQISDEKIVPIEGTGLSGIVISE